MTESRADGSKQKFMKKLLFLWMVVGKILFNFNLVTGTLERHFCLNLWNHKDDGTISI